MSRLLCCRRGTQADMGAALSHPQEGEACDGGGVLATPPTMADVIRERKKKAGGASLGTLRRRIAAAARRPRDSRPDKDCEHGRFIRSLVSRWRLAEVFVLLAELEAAAALRDLVTQAELAREPATTLAHDLHKLHKWCCDVELVGSGWSVSAHRAILAARCTYFKDLLRRCPSARVVSLSGVCAQLSRAELEAFVCALYSPYKHKCDCAGGAETDLDIINSDNTIGRCSCTWSDGGVSVSSLADMLGARLDNINQDIYSLLHSGEFSDTRLSFRLESGGGAVYGFKSALEHPAHRIVLAARSKLLRNVLYRRTGGSSGSPGSHSVCVDENVLPRRFAEALLHAAYTDQVDLSLIGRQSPSPSSTNSTTSSNNAWAGVSRTSSRVTTTQMLDDAFQLYEIGRFLEMPIVVQGCEDAIVSSLSAETLPHVLRWAHAPHASHWVHRQALRYLRDEFTTVMSSPSLALIPRAAVQNALQSMFLQAAEPQALRALTRWAEATHTHHEPNVVWHTNAAGRRGAKRRDTNESALREHIADLLPLVRTEHIPPSNELLQQAIRRGLIPQPPPQMMEEGSLADAWLGRGPYRPPRCFLPYLDELKALLEDQAVPEAEVARIRRNRYLNKIPDTLYMVPVSDISGPRRELEVSSLACVCVPRPQLAPLLQRARALLHAPPARTATALHPRALYTQIALRAVRERSLPDACAELLVKEIESSNESNKERDSGEWESPQVERNEQNWHDNDVNECCRSRAEGGSLRCSSAGSIRSGPSNHHSIENSSRTSTCRRDTSRTSDSANTTSTCGRVLRLSSRVPDVAMAPNANTHLLTTRHYLTHRDYAGAGVMQLDLGDGATHTPRPGSRAQRAAAHTTRPQTREHPQLSSVRFSQDPDELRAAIELSVWRAWSGERNGDNSPARRTNNVPGTLPRHNNTNTATRNRVASASVSAPVHAHRSLAGAPRRSPSPRRAAHYTLYAPRDYRLDPNYGGSASTSRGPSPSSYA